LVETSLYDIAERYIGTKEIPGFEGNPAILAMLTLDNRWPENDEVPWCSAFINYCAWLLRLPRSKSLMARSWLGVGTAITDAGAQRGDVVILWRGSRGGDAGHVGLFSGWDAWDLNGSVPDHQGNVHLLGGNQGDSVSVDSFERDRVVGIRRLTR